MKSVTDTSTLTESGTMVSRRTAVWLIGGVMAWSVTASPALVWAQKESVNPGINDTFRDPDVNDFVKKFEIESREIYAHRDQILKACELKPGDRVADIGAGTGLYTRLFAKAVGEQGNVTAVDIAPKFLDHIQLTCREAGLKNVDAVLCTADSVGLPESSIDVAFICDTYHHFEYPTKTMQSLHKALKPGGRVVVIDFRRIPGQSREWVMNHVRAGQDVVEAEITACGFRKTSEQGELLKENYLVVFEKVD